MTTAPTQPYVSFEDFVVSECGGPRSGEPKHEWLDGVVYAMTGGTAEHARLSVNVGSLLRRAVGGRCTVYSSDLMIFVPETKLATYADVSVVCGAANIQRMERAGRVLGEALLNPSVLVEVLSPSTESYDRGEKFAHCMRIASLKAYVLVSQDDRKIEIFRRPEDRGHWAHEVATAGKPFVLEGETLQVDDVYQ